MRFHTIAAALAATAALAAPALAAEPEARSARVKVTGADFASSQTIARLESRIRRTAHEVCVRPDNSLRPTRSERACIVRALAGAQQELAAVRTRHGLDVSG